MFIGAVDTAGFCAPAPAGVADRTTVVDKREAFADDFAAGAVEAAEGRSADLDGTVSDLRGVRKRSLPDLPNAIIF